MKTYQLLSLFLFKLFISFILFSSYDSKFISLDTLINKFKVLYLRSSDNNNQRNENKGNKNNNKNNNLMKTKDLNTLSKNNTISHNGLSNRVQSNIDNLNNSSNSSTANKNINSSNVDITLIKTTTKFNIDNLFNFYQNNERKRNKVILMRDVSDNIDILMKIIDSNSFILSNIKGIFDKESINESKYTSKYYNLSQLRTGFSNNNPLPLIKLSNSIILNDKELLSYAYDNYLNKNNTYKEDISQIQKGNNNITGYYTKNDSIQNTSISSSNTNIIKSNIISDINHRRDYNTQLKNDIQDISSYLFIKLSPHVFYNVSNDNKINNDLNIYNKELNFDQLYIKDLEKLEYNFTSNSISYYVNYYSSFVNCTILNKALYSLNNIFKDFSTNYNTNNFISKNSHMQDNKNKTFHFLKKKKLENGKNDNDNDKNGINHTLLAQYIINYTNNDNNTNNINDYRINEILKIFNQDYLEKLDYKHCLISENYNNNKDNKDIDTDNDNMNEVFKIVNSIKQITNHNKKNDIDIDDNNFQHLFSSNLKFRVKRNYVISETELKSYDLFNKTNYTQPDLLKLKKLSLNNLFKLQQNINGLYSLNSYYYGDKQIIMSDYINEIGKIRNKTYIDLITNDTNPSISVNSIESINSISYNKDRKETSKKTMISKNSTNSNNSNIEDNKKNNNTIIYDRHSKASIDNINNSTHYTNTTINYLSKNTLKNICNGYLNKEEEIEEINNSLDSIVIGLEEILNSNLNFKQEVLKKLTSYINVINIVKSEMINIENNIKYSNKLNCNYVDIKKNTDLILILSKRITMLVEIIRNIIRKNDFNISLIVFN